MKMFELLRELNSVSPFYWEVNTDGYKFNIYCEGTYCEDFETGTVLENLTEEECENWLTEIIENR